ncbi:MAG TPA: MFS transporter [Actinomycetota bacterium]|nr:MFS transporter [Actinomycetota bacterium]
MGLLRRRDFFLIFVAYALSHFGDYLALITLTLRVESVTDSGWAVAALLLTGLIPPVLLAPVVGVLVDRVETVRLLTVTALFQAAVAAALAVTPGVLPTLGLSFLLGTGVAITQPALFALLPRAVGEDRTTQANAYLEVARWGGAALGPVLAATITGAFGASTTLLANAATFVLVAALVPLIRARRQSEATTEEEEAIPPRAREGVRWLAADPLLRLLVPILGLMIVFAAADNVAEVFFAKDVLGAGDAGYGVLISSWTVGMVIGSTATGRWARPSTLAAVTLVGAIVGGAAVALAAGTAMFPIAVAMFLVGGVANGAELVALRSLLHHRVPDRVRGRAFAAYYGMVQGAQIIALSVSGGLVEVLGARMTMLMAGIGTGAVGVLGAMLYLRIPAGVRGGGEVPSPARPWVTAS